jgi:hypothetical protein
MGRKIEDAKRSTGCGEKQRITRATVAARRAITANTNGEQAQTAGGADADYFEAIDRALTKEAWRRLRAYAAERVRLLESTGYPVDCDLVDELVSDAIADTALGVRAWAPENCDLLGHLRWVIRSRTHHNLLRWRRSPHLYGDAYDLAIEEGTGLAEDGESPESIVGRVEVAHEVFDALCDLAAEREDREVLALLSAYRDGIFEREELARELGMSLGELKSTRARLSRLLQKLPEDLRDAALAVMRGQS